MRKQFIIEMLEKVKKGFENNLNKSSVKKSYRFGFCHCLHEIVQPITVRLIFKELKKDIVENDFSWNDAFFYETIETHGYYSNSQKTFMEKLFGFSKEKIQINNEILQTRIDHLDRTIERLKKEELLEIIASLS